MWVFESSGKLPFEDLKLIVPNGNIKLSVFSRNGITASVNEKQFTSKEGTISLTGLMNVPLTLDTEKDIFTETIGIEFNPKGAYRFFHFNLGEVRNQIIQLSDIIGPVGKHLEELLANIPLVQQKINVLQQFLIKELAKDSGDFIYEYCVDRIITSRGKVTVKELEKKTGYSSRWLNMKFIDKIGVSPKNLSAIICFRECYQAFTAEDLDGTLKNEFYEFYYDQSHYIKNFKHFTGLLPSGIERSSNDFGTKFYKV
jgi:hypothetical protein